MTDYYPPGPQVESEPVTVGPVHLGAMAIASLVLGILAIPCCCCSPCCSSVWGVPALIAGFLELAKINAGTNSPKGRWMAFFGIAMGVVSMAATIVYLAWYLFFGGKAIMDEFYRNFLSQLQ